MTERACPALLISAPASGQGKTLVTAALTRLHQRAGRRVRLFKTGPDFLDPQVLALASTAPVEHLDLWMVGEHTCRRLLYQAAAEADLILIEGVMGLFDGQPSSADLAERFGIPIMAVIDASGMAQTFAAIAHGLASWRPGLPFSGVLANRVGSAGHGQLLAAALPPAIRWYGAVTRQAGLQLPSRHLGLQSEQQTLINQAIDQLADCLASSADTRLPAPVTFRPAQVPFTSPAVTSANTDTSTDTAAGVVSIPDKPLAGVRIAIAKDQAFSFIYPANLSLLRQLGAQLQFFSPLTDTVLPACDALYLCGGYPENALQQLADNQSMLVAIKGFIEAGNPVVAECGGMLYLAEHLTDNQGQCRRLVGALPGAAQMQSTLVALGFQALALPEGCLRGHSFHYSRFSCPLPAALNGECPNGRALAEPVYRYRRLLASYIHFYFPSAPAAVAALFTPG